MSTRRLDIAAGAPGVLLVAALGAMLALQGWRSRVPNFDVLTTIEASQGLIDEGRLPDRGVLTSYASFTPPGATWLMIPGVWVFNEPRLFEYIGSIGLYAGTLFGIFLLARRYLGRHAAVMATVLYGLSVFGLSAAGSLWQRYPIHCFFVWMVYCIAKWVDEDRPTFLALALLTWVAGIYVFLEMAPAILIVPVIWLFYRPSVRIAPLALVALLAAVIWYPYVRFESQRAFVDVRSQVLRQRIQPANFYESWCDPKIAPDSWRLAAQAAASPPPRISMRASLAERAGLTANLLLLANFRTASTVPGTAIPLIVLTVGGLLALFVGSGSGAPHGAAYQGVSSDKLMWLGSGAALAGLLLNEVVLARSLSADGILDGASLVTIRVFQATLLGAGLLLISFRRWTVAAMARAHLALSAPRLNTRVLAISVAVPWIAMLLLADGERIERFWWLWPLQAIPLAAAATYVPKRLGAPPWALLAGSFVLASVVGANTLLLSRIDAWRHSGWSGQDAPEVQASDFVASLIKSTATPPSIGYEVDVWRFMAIYNMVDPRYKVGADIDLLFKSRHGITNLDRCAEGVSDGDIYRIVQAEDRELEKPAGRNRLETERTGDFKMTRQFGPFQVFRRSDSPPGALSNEPDRTASVRRPAS